MATKRPTPLLGRLAVHLKMIDMDQLSDALREHGRVGVETCLGDVLVARGYIDRAQLAKLVATQKQVLEKHRAKQSAVEMSSPEAGPTARRETIAHADSAMDTAPATSRGGGAPGAAAPSSSRPSRPGASVAPEPVVPESSAAAPSPRRADAAPDAGNETGSGAETAPALVRLGEPSAEDRAALESVLRRAVERGASDVHLHGGAPLRVRVAGRLTALEERVLEPAAVERIVLAALTPEQRADLADRGELDLCHTLEGVGRFRANLYCQQRGLDGVFRHIPEKPPSLEDLGLPPRLARYTTYHQGMVLVTGPSGCGKSSTLAALVNLINEERREHILSIEDPIEYLHPSKRCLVNQRCVKTHTGSFARALRAALREDPDVIVIGELRDLETISLALSAAETGHFVLATLHTDNAIRTINRLVGSFPADQQEQIRTMISESLRAVLSQRLLPRADGQGRVPALETLVVTKAVSNLIRENKTFQLQSILQTGARQGMRLLDHAILAHVQDGTVSREDALRHCEDPKTLAA
jgi:twitching motility protein PilT